MISNKEVKRTFKIVLDSTNINSFTGSQFNAYYPIDLTKIINDESAFDKSYKVYCEFITRSDNITNNQITSTLIYTLSLNFIGIGGLQVYQHDMSKNYNFILPVENITDTGGAIHTLLKLNDNMQKPIFLQNIRNLRNINLVVYESDIILQSIFSPTSPTNSVYICILTFEEA